MNKWKVAAGILLIFVLGALTGAIGTGVFVKSRIHRFMDPKGPPPPIRILHREFSRMDLSDNQRLEVNAMLNDMHREVAKHMRQSVPQVKQLFDQRIEKIREKLDPIQQERLDKTLGRIESRMRHMKPPPFPKQGDFPSRFSEKGGAVGKFKMAPMGPPFRGGTGRLPSPGRFQEALELTPEQIEKSDAIVQEMREKRNTIRHRFDREEQKRFSEFELEINRLVEETKSKLATVLSADQMKKLERLSANE